MSDILLENDRVVAEAHSVRVEGQDFELRSLERLTKLGKQNDGPRRAMVHSTTDELIVNFAADYVRTVVHGRLSVQDNNGQRGTLSCEQLMLGNIAELPGNENVGVVMRWFHERLLQLEQAAGVTAPTLASRG